MIKVQRWSVPDSDFSFYDWESCLEVPSQLIPGKGELLDKICALQVIGDSMEDAGYDDKTTRAEIARIAARALPWFGGTLIANALGGCKQRLIRTKEGDRAIILISDAGSGDFAGPVTATVRARRPFHSAQVLPSSANIKAIIKDDTISLPLDRRQPPKPLVLAPLDLEALADALGADPRQRRVPRHVDAPGDQMRPDQRGEALGAVHVLQAFGGADRAGDGAPRSDDHRVRIGII